MNIDIKLLDKCPDLSDYEKDLIKRIDVNHETQASVARFYEKSKSTISLQHRKALKKLTAWSEKTAKQVKTSEEDFDKQVFKLFNKGLHPNKVIEKVGNAKEVFRLWKKYREVMEDDYCLVRNKLLENGIIIDGNSEHPVAEQVESLLWEKFGLDEERTRIWNLLEQKGLTHGLEKDAYDSVHDAVNRLLDKWIQTEHALIDERKRKKAVGQELQETEKKLSGIKIQLENAKGQIQRLERYRKYAYLSKERREKLETDVANARALLSHLREKIRESQNQKTELERQKTELERAMCDRIDGLKEVIFDLRTRARETVMGFLLEMTPNEIVRLAIEARMYAMVKPNPWLVEIAKSLQQTSRRA